jgi:hypothetical protein
LLAVGLAAAYQADQFAVWGLIPAESAFGSNVDEYAIDSRSLSYATLIALLYLSPHLRGPMGSTLHIGAMLAVAAAGSNKFGVAFSALKNAPRVPTVSLVLVAFIGVAVVGFSTIDITAARAALWSDFATNVGPCDKVFGVCADPIVLNNAEGVRSFHSLVLDFTWYGGWPGAVGALFFLWRAATVRSLYGRSAGVLFALALLFGFPPFFNDRHVLVCYAFLVLFQESSAPRLARRPLRADGGASGEPGRPGLVSGG